MHREITTGIGGLSQLKDPSVRVKEATTGVVEPLKRGQASKKYQYLGFCGELYGVPIIVSLGFGPLADCQTCLQRACTRTFGTSDPGAER